MTQELKQQFDRVILELPKSPECLTLATGEYFVRLVVPVWSGQQWVIDQQLVPRLREYCRDQGMEIPHDRVIVFYGSGRMSHVRAGRGNKALTGLFRHRKGQSLEHQG